MPASTKPTIRMKLDQIGDGIRSSTLPRSSMFPPIGEKRTSPSGMTPVPMESSGNESFTTT
jgi:hypothetical protein